MAYTIVKKLTDSDGSTHADAASWTAKFGTAGLERDDITGSIVADGTATVTLTRTFADEDAYNAYQLEIADKANTVGYTLALAE